MPVRKDRWIGVRSLFFVLVGFEPVQHFKQLVVADTGSEKASFLTPDIWFVDSGVIGRRHWHFYKAITKMV